MAIQETGGLTRLKDTALAVAHAAGARAVELSGQISAKIVDRVDKLVIPQVQKLTANHPVPIPSGMDQIFTDVMVNSYLAHVVPVEFERGAGNLRKLAQLVDLLEPDAIRAYATDERRAPHAVARVVEVLQQHAVPHLHRAAAVGENGTLIGLAAQELRRRVNASEGQEFTPEKLEQTEHLIEMANEIGSAWAELRRNGKAITDPAAQEALQPILDKYRALLLPQITAQTK